MPKCHIPILYEDMVGTWARNNEILCFVSCFIGEKNITIMRATQNTAWYNASNPEQGKYCCNGSLRTPLAIVCPISLRVWKTLAFVCHFVSTWIAFCGSRRSFKLETSGFYFLFTALFRIHFRYRRLFRFCAISFSTNVTVMIVCNQMSHSNVCMEVFPCLYSLFSAFSL